MPTDARIGHGAILSFGDGATPTEQFTPLAEVTNISGPGLSRDMPDATHMESEDGWREFIGGLKDAGELTVECNHLPENATQDASTGIISLLDATAPTNWRVTFPVAGSVGVTWEFAAWVSNFEPDTPVDDKMTLSISLKLTGKPALYDDAS